VQASLRPSCLQIPKTMRFKQAACAIGVNVGLAAAAAMLCVAPPQAGSRCLERIDRVLLPRGPASAQN
jgi:hypothetical protein